jgi:hypothetical protein
MAVLFIHLMIFCQLPIDGDEFGLWLKMVCIVLDLPNQARFCRYLTNQWNLLHPQSREQVTCLAQGRSYPNSTKRCYTYLPCD